MEFLYWLRAKKNTTRKTITARITVDGSRKDFSTKITIEPDLWLGAKVWINPVEPILAEYNQELGQIQLDVRKAYNLVKKDSLPMSSQTILDIYEQKKNEQLGLPKDAAVEVPSIMSILQKGMQSKYSKVGLSLTMSSYKRYLTYQSNFLLFLKKNKINPNSMLITDLTLDFCNDFIKRLVTDFKFKQTYANKHREVLRIIIYAAHYEAEGWRLKLLSKDLQKHKESEPDVVYLTIEELEVIESHHFIGRLDRARDMLLVLCEIGQHHGDYLSIVKTGSVEIDKDGDAWISHKRKKTGVEFNILVSERLQRVIDKYDGLENLPCLSDQKANDYLKIVGERCNINKGFSTKIGRKTFADKYLNVVRLDTKVVAKLLGLKDDRYLRHYVRVRKDTLKSYYKMAG